VVLISTQFAVGALLVPLFGQFQEGVGVLKNSLGGRFHPKSDTNRHQTRCFWGYWSPIWGRYQLIADFFNSGPWPLPGHPEAMKMEPRRLELTSTLTGAIHLVRERARSTV
jgi:hypothetical protein